MSTEENSQSRADTTSKKIVPKILIVDDEPLIVEILMAALQDQGYQVFGAHSGEQALRIAQQIPCDVVISDITMARVSGIDLLFELKRIQPTVEVILITGFASVETAQAAVAGGAYRYLKKPFQNLQQVLDVVAEALAAHLRRIREQTQLREAICQQERLSQRLGRVETMYLISHAVGLPENLPKMMMDVAKLLSNALPISLAACIFQEKKNILQQAQAIEKDSKMANPSAQTIEKDSKMAEPSAPSAPQSIAQDAKMAEPSAPSAPQSIAQDAKIMKPDVPSMVQIFAVLLKPLPELKKNKILSLIQRTCPGQHQMTIESAIVSDAPAELERILEIPFPSQEHGLQGSLWLAFNEQRALLSEEEELLEVTAAQMAGSISKLLEFRRQERERMQSIINGMLDGVILLNGKELVLTNQVALQLFHAATFTELANQLEQNEIWQFMSQFQKEQRTIGREMKLKDGRVFSITIWQLANTGEWTSALVLHDVTQQYTLQKELERSRRLCMVGELVAGVAHEINTPLTVILGYSQLMMTQKIPHELMHDLDTICQESVRCQKLIQNLLGLARSRTSEKMPMEIADLVDKVLELKQYDLRKRAIKVIREYSSERILVLVDPGQIQQVFLNLINNAQDAMEQQTEKRLEIRITSKENRALIAIADSGTGILAENFDKIFYPFFTTKEIGKGSGLGLSICYRIIEEHKGKISAANRSDQRGAIFSIELPIAVTGEKGNLQSLIIASQQELVQLISYFLKRNQMQSKVVMNEEAALHSLEATSYDIILLDATCYPDTVLEQFLDKMSKQNPKKSIVFCDDRLSPHIQDILQQKQFHLLDKPFSLSEFETMFKGALQTK